MIAFLALLQAGFSAWNFEIYSHSHHALSLIAGVVSGVGALYALVVAASL